MAVVLSVVIVVIVVAIAAAFVGRETQLLARQEHRPTYRLPEAVEFVAERLDDEHAERMTHDELSTLLRLHILLLQDQAVAGVGAEAPVVTDDPGVVAVAEAAAAEGLEVPLDTIMASMSLQLDYLKALGALEIIE